VDESWQKVIADQDQPGPAEDISRFSDLNLHVQSGEPDQRTASFCRLLSFLSRGWRAVLGKLQFR